jgi:hypothetical protein
MCIFQGQQTRAEEEFQSLLLQVEAKVLNSWRSGGLTLLQKCCAAGLGRTRTQCTTTTLMSAFY